MQSKIYGSSIGGDRPGHTPRALPSAPDIGSPRPYPLHGDFLITACEAFLIFLIFRISVQWLFLIQIPPQL